MEKFPNAEEFKNVIDDEKISSIIKCFIDELKNKKPGSGQFVLISENTKGFISLNLLEFEKLKSLADESGWIVEKDIGVGGEVYVLRFK